MTGQHDHRHEIDRVLTSYALLQDSGDVAGCVALFTEDCEVAISGGTTLRGHDDLYQFLESAPERGASGIHLLGPALIDVGPDRSATVWQSFLFVADGSNRIGRGMYRDVMTLDGEDRWRFRRRVIDLYPGSA